MNERFCNGDGQMQSPHVEALHNACMDYGNIGLEKLAAWSTRAGSSECWYMYCGMRFDR
jgi:hypothetical protein